MPPHAKRKDALSMVTHCDFRTMRHKANYVIFRDGSDLTRPLIITFSSWRQVKRWLRDETRFGLAVSCSVHAGDGRLCAYIKNGEVTRLAP